MCLIQGEQLEKYFGARLIFKIDDLKILPGDRIGLVGPNGAGKTTLLNVLAGTEASDGGRILRRGKLAYIRQLGEEDGAADPKLTKLLAVPPRNSSAVSGGERIRIKVANALSQSPDLLIADEPTANLDYTAICLVREELAKVSTLLLVSHDRETLNLLCRKILHLEKGELRVYQGNYDQYCQQRLLEKEQAQQRYAKFQATKGHLEEARASRQTAAKTMRKAPKRMGNSEARLHKGEARDRRTKVQAASKAINSRLEQLVVVEKPWQQREIRIDFARTAPPANPRILEVQHLDYSYGSCRALADVSLTLGRGEKLAFWGPNGSGKSTLLRMLATQTSAGIYRVPKLRIGYFAQGLEQLTPAKTALDNVLANCVQSEAVARTVMARLLLSSEDGQKPVAILSGGERVKVALAKLIVSDANALFLDEVTNYLDLPAVEALQSVLTGYPGAVIIATHDAALIRGLADSVLIFDQGRIAKYQGDPREFGPDRQLLPRENTLEKTVIQMRMAAITAKMMQGEANLPALEQEYSQLRQALEKTHETG